MTDLKNLEQLVQEYIDENFEPSPSEYAEEMPSSFAREVTGAFFSGIIGDMFSHADRADRPARRPLSVTSPDEIDFSQLQTGETFSEMLLRLIDERGEKNSVVYTRANIDRRHFSKIVNRDNYKPSKQTVLAFAIALKLDFEQMKELLAVAGFTLTKANLADVIVSFFIEYKIFDVNRVNQILYKYDQPLLGG